MSRLSTNHALAVLACTLFFGSGCSNPTTIHGTVTYDGKEVGKGAVTFVPTEGQGPSVGAKIKDGKYYVEDALPGSYKVSVIGVKKVNFARDPAELQRMSNDAIAAGRDSGGLVEPADIIPANAVGNNQTVEVKEGDQILDFHIKPPTE